MKVQRAGLAGDGRLGPQRRLTARIATGVQVVADLQACDLQRSGTGRKQHVEQRQVVPRPLAPALDALGGLGDFFARHHPRIARPERRRRLEPRQRSEDGIAVLPQAAHKGRTFFVEALDAAGLAQVDGQRLDPPLDRRARDAELCGDRFVGGAVDDRFEHPHGIRR